MQLVFSGLLTEALSAAFNFQYGLLLSKILVDCFLFLTNFIVQRFWIFPTNRIMDSQKKNRHTFAFFYTAILIAATVWSLLDTFVIADKVAAVDQNLANTTIYADLENEYSSAADSANTLDEDLYNGSSNSAFVEDATGSSSGSIFIEDTAGNSSDSALAGESAINVGDVRYALVIRRR